MGERVGDALHPTWKAGSKFLEVGTKERLLCGGSGAGFIPFGMALLNQCCTQKFWFLTTSPNFADSLGPSPTHGGGGGVGRPPTIATRWTSSGTPPPPRPNTGSGSGSRGKSAETRGHRVWTCPCHRAARATEHTSRAERSFRRGPPQRGLAKTTSHDPSTKFVPPVINSRPPLLDVRQPCIW